MPAKFYFDFLENGQRGPRVPDFFTIFLEVLIYKVTEEDMLKVPGGKFQAHHRADFKWWFRFALICINLVKRCLLHRIQLQNVEIRQVNQIFFFFKSLRRFASFLQVAFSSTPQPAGATVRVGHGLSVLTTCLNTSVEFFVPVNLSPFEFPLRNGWTHAGYKWLKPMNSVVQHSVVKPMNSVVQFIGIMMDLFDDTCYVLGLCIL